MTAVYVVVVLATVAYSIVPTHYALAGTTLFDFSTPGNYTPGDAAAIEVSSNTTRLKSQQYATDGNTSAYWRFDEAEGGGAETSADDTSANNNDVTFSTTTPCAADGGVFGAGKIQNAVTLNGVPNCATASDSPSLSINGVSPSMTIEALVKFPSAFDADADIRQGIVDKGNYRMYFSESDGKLKFEMHDSATKTWGKVGGSSTTNIVTTEGLNGGWRQYLPGTVQVIQEYNSSLYIGTYGTAANGGTAEVWKYSSGTSWTKVAGDGVLNDQWDNVTFEGVLSMVVHGGLLYMGLGFGAGDGELWSYDDSPETLTRVRVFTNAEEVVSLASDGTYIYVGTGVTASDADVWRCQTTCTTGGNWTQIGGDTANSWNTGYERVRSMVVMGGTVYAGLGDTAAEAEVWRYSGSGNTWTKVGGDSVGSSWAAAGNYEYVFSLATDGTTLYAGLGASASDAEVYACSSCGGTPAWTKIGGDTANNWNANYETVRQLSVIGSTLFAAVGDTAGEAEVWRYSGSGDTWTKIAGDGVNSTWDASFTAPAGVTNTKEQVYLGVFGSDLVAGTGTTPQDAEVWRCTANCTSGTPTWSWIGGRDFNSWGAAQLSQVGTMTIHDGKLYVGFGIATKHAVLYEYDGSTWTQIGGGGLNGSNWEAYEFIRASATYNGDLYVGMGDTASDADVWRWNGSTWTQISGNEVHGSIPNWNINYEYVSSLVSDGTTLFAGLGASASDAEVWAWNGTTWTKIGGDSASNWNTGFEHVWSMAVYGSTLFAGLGQTAGDAEIWRYSGAGVVWTKIAGDGLNSSWNTVFENVRAMTFIGDKLYAGLGDTADEATVADGEVWECTDCMNTGGTPAWTQVGGDGLNDGWNTTDYEWVSSLIGYNGDLYAAVGNEAGDAEIWRYVGSSWSKVGGDGSGTPATWSTNYEAVNALTVFGGKLYAGLGNTNNTVTASDGEVWEYGGNTAKVTVSSRSSWSADTWYHVAAVYNGTDAKLYVDGVQDGATNTYGVTLNDNNKTLSVGNLKSPFTSDGPYGGFTGVIDELRISSSARTSGSFVLTQYSTSAQTIQPSAALSRAQKHSWNDFTVADTLNGGAATYRLSDDNATTWKYWDGSGWSVSNSTSLANNKSVVDANIASFPITTAGLLWQAILLGNGDQQVTVNSVTIGYVDDTEAPNNPSSVTATADCNGTNVINGGWCNNSAPQFSWSAPTDPLPDPNPTDEQASGVAGYYIYFGTNATAVPRTSGVFQSGTTFTPTGLVSGSTYYFRMQTMDAAQNVSDDVTGVFDGFTYKYDSVAPTPPTTVSVSPSGYTSVNSYTFIWPVTGGSAPYDTGAPTTGSGLSGYQYKTGAPSGILSDWSSVVTNGSGEVVIPDAAYQEGANTFSLRYVDVAGNASAPATATYYYAGSAPGAPLNLQVSPSSSEGAPQENNAFSFSWDQPEYFNGSIKQYHFSVNKLPTSTNTTATPFRTLASAPYATQQGKNSFYIVAEDEAGNINYSIYASVDFYTQTPAPSAPTALQIFDISNRDTQEYAISMKWTEPTKAAGFDGYEVYRSEDGTIFTSAGTTKSPVFIDTNLTSKSYYYRVRSKDNAGQYSADSTIVTIIPTGRYTSAPKLLDGPSLTAKSFSAEVEWTTDRVGSSFVEFGSDQAKIGKENGGETIGQLDLLAKHEVTLLGLNPETTYYYRSVWVDQDGNRGQSDLLTFQTGLRPKISDVKISNISLSSADVSWISTTVSSSTINYGTTRSFGQSISNLSGSQTTKHTLRLEALTDATTYFFVITGQDIDGNSLASDEYTFTTLTRPRITNFLAEPVKDAATTSMKFSWTTNVPTTTILTYTRTGQTAKSKSDSEYVTDHSMTIESLSDNSPYQFAARGVDRFGNVAQGTPLTLTTPDDSRPPKVLNMTIELRSSGVGATQKAQLVVSWETDEPSTSQVEYGPGISSDSYPSRTQEDSALTNNHVVIVPELEPAKLYHLRAVSRDRANNAGTSADTTAITGKVQRSVVDIIISSLQRSLGFLSAIPGIGQ